MTKRRSMLWVLAAAVVAIVASGIGAVVSSRRSPPRGPQQGRLRPCSDTPNCVCSFDVDSAHAVEPLEAGADAVGTMDRLRNLLRSTPRVRVTEDVDEYLHAEFTTPVLRFVDDVEFLCDADAGVIHVRSASRVGYSDFGANRRRVEQIRERLSGDAN